MVNFPDIVPAYSGLIAGIASTIASLSGIIGNVIAGIIIKQPTLHDWRKLFILLGIVYFIGGIIYIFLGSAVPEEWAILKSQEQIQNVGQSQEETLPIQEEEQIDKIKALEDVKANQTARNNI
jgi:MFS family permease